MEHQKELKHITDRFTTISLKSIEQLYKSIDFCTIPSGTFLKSGQLANYEYFILSGIGRLFVTTDEGADTTISFLTPSSIAPPLKTRVLNGKSTVDIEAYSELLVGQIDSRIFFEMCIENPEIMILGTKMMEQCLIEKAQKEIALATLKGIERLSFIRSIHPGLENQVSHQHIASYLGITNVSLSRLRAKNQVIK